MTNDPRTQRQGIPASPVESDQPTAENTSGVVARATPLAFNYISEQADSLLGRAENTASRLAAGAQNINEARTEFLRFAASRNRVFTHVPNRLDQYANYTYHIRWSITDDIVGSSIRSATEFQYLEKVIVAESGGTAGFNITEFEIENLCSPQDRVQTMLHQKWRMRIVEPYGLSLIDRIYSLSRLMGVRNHLSNSTFIEVWFTGYDENGNIATTDMKQTMYKLFRVNVQKIKSDTKSSGTVYDIEGIFSNMYANSDHVATASVGTTVGPVSNVGEFFRSLQDAWNDQQQNLQYDFRRRVEYEFQIPQWMYEMRFNSSAIASRRQGSIDVNDPQNTGTPTITISAGMDLNTILYAVLSMSDDGRRFIAGDHQASANGTAPRTSVTGASSLSSEGQTNVIVIHSRSDIVGFDHTTRDYLRKMTYTFMQYVTGRPLIDQGHVQNILQPSQQSQRQQAMARSRRFNKSYEYIYTGNNLDIIKLDINMEWLWQAPIPTQLGENTYSNFSPGAQLDARGVSTDILSGMRDAQSRYNRARAEERRVIGANPGDSEEARRAREAATEARTQAERELSAFGTASRFQERWERPATPGNELNNGEQVLRNTLIRLGDQDLLANREVLEGLRARRNWSQATQGRRDLYLEDVQVVDFYSTAFPISFRTNPGPINQRTNILSDQSVDRNGNNTVDNLPRNRSLVSAVLNDLTTSPYFVRIELEIRGDPYWLGLGNIEEDRQIGNGQRYVQPTSESAWFLGGDVGFFLTFRTGEAPSEDTGIMEFKNSSIAFTGLYTVLRVKNVFKDGKFTQVLTSIRDPLSVPRVADQNAGSGPNQPGNGGQPAAAARVAGQVATGEGGGVSVSAESLQQANQ